MPPALVKMAMKHCGVRLSSANTPQPTNKPADVRSRCLLWPSWRSQQPRPTFVEVPRKLEIDHVTVTYVLYSVSNDTCAAPSIGVICPGCFGEGCGGMWRLGFKFQ